MTVSELIEELQKQLPNSEVVMYDYEFDEELPVKVIEANADGKVVIYAE